MTEPFSAFMARALFDPERGYYSRRIKTVGARGDFSTSATLSPLLGRGIAAWLKEEMQRQQGVRHVIEIGAGDGSLMSTVQKERGWWTRRRLQFHIVDTSPVLRERQREKLGRAVTAWHVDLGAALQACGGAAFLYHNELLDAFPVTLVEWNEGEGGGAWKEVHVTTDPRGVREELHALVLTLQQDQWADFSVLRAAAPGWAKARQRCELHVSVRDWLRGWAPHWRQGAMLTVDYGDEFPALYHRRPRGTLRAYLMQQRLEGPAVYANPGRQDITADINFTDYRRWAKDLGWEEVMYGTQAAFLKRHGKAPPAAADAFVMEADGAGGAFKCVVHRKTEMLGNH